ncbi:ABC transporter ATP-binding protein [Haloarchaeobius salinus]|uniref:ABC transporter ATP-binding protein n=1 Tax=Haloarchaeobius salinus TaxID=1198298 RepID=UPI00210E8024|nr:ABC transporter ATP-binding protein [Haloarchaeobius salinus]
MSKTTLESDQRAVLEVENLQKYFTSGGRIDRIFGEQKTIQAVEDVSFHLGKNETLALIGESGCGKSTVAKTLIGIHEPTEGEIRFKGELMTPEKVRTSPIQLIFQDASESLNQKKTVGSILATPLKLNGNNNTNERINELLTKVGLDPSVKNRHPGTFSGGQKQRIAIARALASDPELLIADEPVSGLDVSVQAKIINLLDKLTSEMGVSLLVISHNLGVVRTISDRVHIMYMGEIVEKGDTEDVFERPAHPYTRALLSSIHVPDPSIQMERVELPGELPDPSDPPEGCRFSTRCPQYIGSVCDEVNPELTESSSNSEWPIQGNDHCSACHKHDE